MPVVEIEIRRNVFIALVTMLLRSGPLVPFASVPQLGGHWISKLVWSSIILPNEPNLGGELRLQAEAELAHIDPAEAALDPTASPQITAATLALVAKVKLASKRLDLIIEVSSITTLGATKEVSIQIVKNTLKIPEMPGGKDFAAAAVIASDAVVTIRLATSPHDNMSLPPSERLLADASVSHWLIHAPGDFFSALILNALQEMQQRDDVTVESAPVADWVNDGVSAAIGLEAEDACGYVDISIDVRIQVQLLPSRDENGSLTGSLTAHLTITAITSQWDTFRCWAMGGILGTDVLSKYLPGYLGAFAGPVVALLTLGSLLLVVGQVEEEVAIEVLGQPLPETGIAWKKVSQSDDSASYAATLPLPALMEDSVFNSVEVGSDGLTVCGNFPHGDFIINAVSQGLPEHDVKYAPVSPVTTLWRTQIDCNHRTVKFSVRLPELSVRDDVKDLPAGLGPRTPVKLYRFTGFPSGTWFGSFEKNGPGVLSIEPMPGPNVRQNAVVLLHTTSGLHRYDIRYDSNDGPVRAFAEASNLQHVVDVFCDTFTLPPSATIENIKDSMKLKWWEFPPGYDHGYPPLQQWLLTAAEVPRGLSLMVRALRSEQVVEHHSILHVSDAPAPLALELVTRDVQALALVCTGDETGLRMRVAQRWILPQHVIALRGPVRAMTRLGAFVAVLVDDRLLLISTASLEQRSVRVGRDSSLRAERDVLLVLDQNGAASHRLALGSTSARTSASGRSRLDLYENRIRAGLLFTLTLPDGRVVANHEGSLVIGSQVGPVRDARFRST